MYLKGNLKLGKTNSGRGKKIARTACKIKPIIHLFHWTLTLSGLTYPETLLKRIEKSSSCVTEDWYEFIILVCIFAPRSQIFFDYYQR